MGAIVLQGTANALQNPPPNQAQTPPNDPGEQIGAGTANVICHRPQYGCHRILKLQPEGDQPGNAPELGQFRRAPRIHRVQDNRLVLDTQKLITTLKNRPGFVPVALPAVALGKLVAEPFGFPGREQVAAIKPLLHRFMVGKAVEQGLHHPVGDLDHQIFQEDGGVVAGDLAVGRIQDPINAQGRLKEMKAKKVLDQGNFV